VSERQRSGGPEQDRVPRIDSATWRGSLKAVIAVLTQLDERGDMTRPEINAWQALAKEFCGSERVEDLREYIVELRAQISKLNVRSAEQTLMGMNPLTIPSREELSTQSPWGETERERQEREAREAREHRSKAPTREENVPVVGQRDRITGEPL